MGKAGVVAEGDLRRRPLSPLVRGSAPGSLGSGDRPEVGLAESGICWTALLRGVRGRVQLDKAQAGDRVVGWI